MNKIHNLIIIIGFCLAIFIPFLMSAAQSGRAVSQAENRSLAKSPALPKTIREMQGYPAVFNAYYADNFGLRNWLLKYYRNFKRTLGDTPTQDVTIGQDGWLFLGSIKNGYKKYDDPFGDVRNKNLYSQTELKEFAHNISDTNAWLELQGIKYVFTIAPNKHSIYFEHLPSYIQKLQTISATDQLLTYLNKHTEVPIVDLRPALMRAKSSGQLYFKTDSHWNHMGANIAQYEIMKKIAGMFPDKITPSLYSLTARVGSGKDLANQIGTPNFLESDPKPNFQKHCRLKKSPKTYSFRQTHSWSCDTQILKALIFRDSFFTHLETYFIRKFAHSTFVWSTLTRSKLEKQLKSNRPNIVIEEWVERALPRAYTHEFKGSLLKLRFIKSKNTVYNLSHGKLRYKSVDAKQSAAGLTLTSKSAGPMVFLPPLPLKPDTQYTVHIKLHSSIKSRLRLYYSLNNKVGYPFSHKNSVFHDLKKGSNDIYLPLSHPNLSKLLRIDPFNIPGEVTIEALEIQEIARAKQKNSAPVQFINQEPALYTLKDKNLKFLSLDIGKNSGNSLSLTSLGKDPIIYFPSLPLLPNKKYMLHVNMSSSVKSRLRLYLSQKNNKGFPFSQKNSLPFDVTKGENDIYLPFHHSNIGNRLRFDPLMSEGKITINALEIRPIPDN